MTDPTPRRRGRPPAADAAEAPRVEAVERALSLLETFADGRPRLSLAEMAQRAGLYPSTVLRLAASLAQFGYLRRDEDGMFRLGPAPLRLGALYQAGFNLAELLRPALARLVERSGETAAFYVRDGEDRICLYRQHGPRPIRHHVEEGARLPVAVGASGRVLSAFGSGTTELDAAIRAAGVYLSRGERDPESAAVAAPVLGAGGRLVGALSVTGLLGRIDTPDSPALLRLVAEEAAAVSRMLGG